MIRQEMLDQISTMADEELTSSNAIFPLFNSAHEGYAVLKEEIEETLEESEALKENADSLWHQVKNNTNTTLRIEIIENRAIRCAAEAIQVAAMCRKYRDSLNNKN